MLLQFGIRRFYEKSRARIPKTICKLVWSENCGKISKTERDTNASTFFTYEGTVWDRSDSIWFQNLWCTGVISWNTRSTAIIARVTLVLICNEEINRIQSISCKFCVRNIYKQKRHRKLLVSIEDINNIQDKILLWCTISKIRQNITCLYICTRLCCCWIVFIFYWRHFKFRYRFEFSVCK